MLVSSLLVTATSMSASSAPAWRNTVGNGPCLARCGCRAVAEVAQAVAVGVDHGDVVGFAGQVLGQCAADLAGTEDDFHGRKRLVRFRSTGGYLDQLGIVEAIVALHLRQQLAAVGLFHAQGAGKVQFAGAGRAGEEAAMLSLFSAGITEQVA